MKSSMRAAVAVLLTLLAIGTTGCGDKVVDLGGGKTLTIDTVVTRPDGATRTGHITPEQPLALAEGESCNIAVNKFSAEKGGGEIRLQSDGKLRLHNVKME